MVSKTTSEGKSFFVCEECGSVRNGGSDFSGGVGRDGITEGEGKGEDGDASDGGNDAPQRQRIVAMASRGNKPMRCFPVFFPRFAAKLCKAIGGRYLYAGKKPI